MPAALQRNLRNMPAMRCPMKLRCPVVNTAYSYSSCSLLSCFRSQLVHNRTHYDVNAFHSATTQGHMTGTATCCYLKPSDSCKDVHGIERCPVCCRLPSNKSTRLGPRRAAMLDRRSSIEESRVTMTPQRRVKKIRYSSPESEDPAPDAEPNSSETSSDSVVSNCS